MNTIQELTLREQENVQFTKNGTNQLIKKIVIALDTATTYFPVTLLGNMVYGLDSNDASANLNIQFNRVSSEVDQFPLYSGLGYVAPFDRFYLSWSAQAGKTITLLVGSLGKDVVDIIDNRSATTQTTLLTSILAELQGISTAGNDAADATVGTSAVSALAANASRKACLIQADITNTGKIYLGFTNAVTTTRKVVALQAGQTFSVDDYRGDIYAISDVAGQKISASWW